MEDKEMKEEERLVEVSLIVPLVRCSHFKACFWQRGSKWQHDVDTINYHHHPPLNSANNKRQTKTLMPNEMTTGNAFFYPLPFFFSFCPFYPPPASSLPSKCGKLLTGVNGTIAQGNNQQMEYAKWRRDRRQRMRETDRDKSRRI